MGGRHPTSPVPLPPPIISPPVPRTVMPRYVAGKMSGDNCSVKRDVPSPGAGIVVRVNEAVIPSGRLGTVSSSGELKSTSGLWAVVTSKVAESPGNKVTNAGSTLTEKGATPGVLGLTPHETAPCMSPRVTPGGVQVSAARGSP